MALTAQQRAEQMKQAEELLFSGPQALGFAKGLYYGHFNPTGVFPYPQLPADQQEGVEAAVAEVKHFAEESIDPFRIDREANIPPEVIAGLGKLGVLGMTIPVAYGGRGMSQFGYCKVMEVVGGHDAGVAVFVNAHHSIGLRGLLLAGTEDQRSYWLPPLARGEKLAAFALTEPEAGSDAANVQTTATPTPDGQAYLINGQKRYITNGGIAQMLTVMARTPVPGSDKTQVTAFIVTPDMAGFEIVAARMPKCGIRGTATAKLAFRDMRVPAANILGQLGKGLKLALTVLDFGRTTFGASCTGAAKFCVRAAARHAGTRKQFGQRLGEFELVKKKLAHMAADTFAMESAVYHCAALIDSGAEDYMLETAMLKVFSTEALWRIVNDTIQIFGGQAYFSDEPYERMMRDARINQIGEGANDVLRAFIALLGLRNVGEMLKGGLDAIHHPVSQFGTWWRFARDRLAMRFRTPEVPVRHSALQAEAHELGRRVRDFGVAVEGILRNYREEVLERQYQQERLAEVATELYMSACVISRLDSLLSKTTSNSDNERDVGYGRFYLRAANRRIKQHLASLWDNDDEQATKTADLLLGLNSPSGNGEQLHHHPRG
jgi:alkylation response protein AidB-like acyl-CoA dehydrogenase